MTASSRNFKHKNHFGSAVSWHSVFLFNSKILENMLAINLFQIYGYKFTEKSSSCIHLLFIITAYTMDQNCPKELCWIKVRRKDRPLQ